MRQSSGSSIRPPPDPAVFVLPELTVGELASQMKQRLEIHVVRVVGDSGMKVTKVGRKVLKAELIQPSAELGSLLPRFTDAGKIALHIGGKHRNANAA